MRKALAILENFNSEIEELNGLNTNNEQNLRRDVKKFKGSSDPADGSISPEITPLQGYCMQLESRINGNHIGLNIASLALPQHRSQSLEYIYAAQRRANQDNALKSNALANLNAIFIIKRCIASYLCGDYSFRKRMIDLVVNHSLRSAINQINNQQAFAFPRSLHHAMWDCLRSADHLSSRNALQAEYSDIRSPIYRMELYDQPSSGLLNSADDYTDAFSEGSSDHNDATSNSNRYHSYSTITQGQMASATIVGRRTANTANSQSADYQAINIPDHVNSNPPSGLDNTASNDCQICHQNLSKWSAIAAGIIAITCVIIIIICGLPWGLFIGCVAILLILLYYTSITWPCCSSNRAEYIDIP